MNLYWVKTWNLYHPVKQRNKKTQIKAFNHSNNKTRVNFFLYDVHSPSNTTSLWSYLCQILLFAFQLYATPPLTFLRLVLTDLILGFLTPATLNTADSFLPFPGPFCLSFCLFLPMDIFCVWKTKLSAWKTIEPYFL